MAEVKKAETRLASISIHRDWAEKFSATELVEARYEFEFLDAKQHVRVRDRRYPDKWQSLPYSVCRFNWTDKPAQ